MFQRDQGLRGFGEPGFAGEPLEFRGGVNGGLGSEIRYRAFESVGGVLDGCGILPFKCLAQQSQRAGPLMLKELREFLEQFGIPADSRHGGTAVERKRVSLNLHDRLGHLIGSSAGSNNTAEPGKL